MKIFFILVSLCFTLYAENNESPQKTLLLVRKYIERYDVKSAFNYLSPKAQNQLTVTTYLAASMTISFAEMMDGEVGDIKKLQSILEKNGLSENQVDEKNFENSINNISDKPGFIRELLINLNKNDSSDLIEDVIQESISGNTAIIKTKSTNPETKTSTLRTSSFIKTEMGWLIDGEEFSQN